MLRYLLLASLQALCTEQIPTNLFLSSRTGKIQECNLEHPCPTGYDCIYSPINFGVKSCYPSVPGGTVKPTGSCPVGSNGFAGNGLECDFDHECAHREKCCFEPSLRAKTCKTAVPIPSSPTITVLQAGEEPAVPGGFIFKGTMVLVQSSQKNILVDTGTPTQKIDLVRNLQELSGLGPKDIDFVITSHGHPDHYSNVNLFPDTPNNFWTFTGIGSKYLINPLAPNKRLLVLSDPNVEIVKTPGHSAEDTSVIVSNVPQYGTVIIAGDIVLEESDEGIWERFAVSERQQRESRRLIFCKADYIVPGHGPMFKVTFEMKRRYAC